ncbi:uncharacterized protein [Asterias amurensis]|uniref:uncharacterized protein n=1 Tax=Asterias amurensis TaxID=7602 RepID=UPI003AB24C57
MSTPRPYPRYHSPDYANQLARISRALTGTDDVEMFKNRLRCEEFGCGELERKSVLVLLNDLHRRRKITPDKPHVLVQILRDIGKTELIREEFPEFYVADPTVSDKDLDWLASQMGPEWESFARQQLEIPQSSIDQCKANVYPVNVQQQIFKVLAEWKRRQGLDATYDAMGNKLHQFDDFQRLWHEWNERLHPN